MSRGGALAGAGAISLATACSLLLSPDDLSRGQAAPAGGDAAIVSADAGDAGNAVTNDGGCTDLPHAVSFCPGFCNRMASKPTYCEDFDDAGLEGPPLNLSYGNGGVAAPTLDASASPPGSLVADVPANAKQTSYAYASRIFNATPATHVRLSLDIRMEGTSGYAAVLALLFAPDMPISHRITVNVNQDTMTTTVFESQSDTNSDAGDHNENSATFSSSIPYPNWSHLDMDTDFSTRHTVILLDGTQVANLPLSAGWDSTKVELILGMAYAAGAFRFHYDNVVLTVQP